MALMSQRASTTNAFHWKTLSRRQKQLLTWWTPGSPFEKYNGVIADGAIRSGKTVCMALSFVMWAMTNFREMNFGICGKTIGSLRRNVIKDLKLTATGRGYHVDHHRGEKLIIIRKGDVTNYFYEFGGRDESSQDLIQGVTLAGVMFDEVALMPESFVNQATGRCSVTGSKFWFNCNPMERLHWFKMNWINRYQKEKLLYVHFSLDDNYSLDEAVKARYRSMYTGVFYRRYIEGEWCAAEGVIYDDWNEDENSFDANEVRPWEKVGVHHYIGVDYGTTNPTVFLDCYDDGNIVYITREYYQDSKAEQMQKSPYQHGDDMDAFCGEDRNVIVIVDPAAGGFKMELKNRGYWVRDAVNDVLPGIELCSTMIHKRLVKVDKSCVNFRKEINSYVWDDKARQRGEERPLKQKDHAMDAMRYLLATTISRFELRRRTERGG